MANYPRAKSWLKIKSRLRTDRLCSSAARRCGFFIFPTACGRNMSKTETQTNGHEHLRTLALEDIQALAHGESIPRFVGRIKKVWEQKSDEGEYGRWYLQNLIVSMDDGEVSVTWTGEDAFDEAWEGRTVAFE